MKTSSKKNAFVFALTLLLGFLGASFIFAESPTLPPEPKEYCYDLISVDIVVNKDSTFDVIETQHFVYQGQFNQGWRSISFQKISAISDIQVIDGETLEPLVFSKKKLDKTNPQNWGKFTYYKENNSQIIEWYYNLKDITHTWILKYKVHGGIGFYKDHDEIYWNLFTDYDAPVLKTEAFVKLPENNFSLKDFQLQLYVDPEAAFKKSQIIDNKNFYFSLDSKMPSNAKVTIAVGWPKGLIFQSAFWKDFFRINFGYILSFVIAFLSILSGFFYWYFGEKYKKGKGTIVPQYEPPQNLRPAMAEVVCKEGITARVWPATIIDLAVRGYLKIIKEKLSSWDKFIIKSSYRIEKIKDFKDDPDLEDYEKKFLNILFGNNDSFSTKELQRSGKSKKTDLFMKFIHLEKSLYEEIDSETNIFEKKLSQERKKRWIIILTIILSFFILVSISNQYAFLLFVVIASSLILYTFIKYEARLSKEGVILKEEWLGFRLYLATAEKYRMQNLTPEIFEKYLPYAMIFGIERKWGKAFESLNLQSPSWYGGGVVATGPHSGFGAESFSPSSFSASLSSSFASAFSSSGATGGGTGGGGGAGGGGGGGGGGAS